ncbi:MAG: threonine synthase, partial [Solobacterium sp.]|nr:threonine synthase [Solobacterium sp.]
WFAKKLGLPVNRLIVSSNTNNVLTDFFNTGTYSVKRPFHTTMSPSMDILISSNLERLLFMASGNDDVLVRDLMGKLKNDGIYTIPDTLKETIGRDFSGVWCNEEECADVIYDVFNREGLLVDPHTAVGIAGMQKYRQESGDHTPCIVLSTASAYKFAHDVLKSLKEEDPEDDFAAMEHLHEVTGTAVPPNLASLKDMPIRFTRVIDREDGIHVIAKRMEELGK